MEKSTGYEKLKMAVKKDCNDGRGCFNPNGCNNAENKPGVKGCFHRYCDKFKWVVERAKHYGEKLGLNWEDVLNQWEADRGYWYMNYYQESNQPEIGSTHVRVFETVSEMLQSIGDKGFRCPVCGGVSTSPYACNSGMKLNNEKICDWKVYGLLRDLGKGVFVYCKDKLRGETIFTPIAWEKTVVVEKETNV
ncbi:hypothetical protein Psch_03435 [Pelotomaculum schinkii]|uniref:Uncharacterized protein n=1 Tax=Pelotomaculum schinkii TaxID=78350 RepID=A0A4Y7R7E9_9FIRM|nr:hypothetical protein [Pelotomaculum schinkii]TEB04673.1 hypothetical protein Psch_03435 [Pelotomaculum schinkii]